MNKKSYIKPYIKVNTVDIEPLLAASFVTNDSIPEKDNSNNQFAKKNGLTPDLWDSSWEEPEEEDQ